MVVKKKTYITGVRVRDDRAMQLREKAMQLTVKSKEYVTEADLVNFLIDEMTERIDIDEHGLFIPEEEAVVSR